MSHELLYTSAPKGLKPGSRGFCTVVCTQGMPPPLSTALESLSAYRPVYPSGDRNAANNPVVWSHVKMNVAGRAYHVLSRVADYGLDFTQRGNKLAHHVALDTAEQVAGGPAALLELPGFMDTTWNGQPRQLPAGRPIRPASRPPAVCVAWQSLTGDAGWAGVVAESFLQAPDRPIYIVFAPGMDLLPLMAEAIALLPADRRWDVTFSTYFTSIPPGVTCAIRCVLSGSPEAEQARNLTRALHINLCEPLPPATGGDLVQAARTGRVAAARSQPPQFATADGDWTDDELASELELSPVDPDEPTTRHSAPSIKFSEHIPALPVAGYGVTRRPPGPPALPPPPPVPGRPRRTLADLNAADARRWSKWIRWVIACLAFVVVGLAVAVSVMPTSRSWILRRMPWQKEPAKEIVANNPAKAHPSGHQPGNADEEETNDVLGHLAEPESDNDDGKKDEVDRSGSSLDKAEDGKAESGSKAEKTTPPVVDSLPKEDERPTEQNKNESPKPGSPAKESDASTVKYDGKALKPIDASTKDYELYYVDAAMQKRLEIPVHGRDAEWELHLPTSFTVQLPNGFTPFAVGRTKPGRRELLKPGGTTGKPEDPVFNIVESVQADVLALDLQRTGDDCQGIEWCVISVKEPAAPIRLFALQNDTLDWEKPAFKNCSWKLPFNGQKDKHSIPNIEISRVTINLNGFPNHYVMNRSGANQPNNNQEFLQSEGLDKFAQQILEIDKQIDLLLEVIQNPDPMTLKFPKIDKLDWFADHFKPSLDGRVTPINNITGVHLGITQINPKNIYNEMKSGKTNHLESVKKQIDDRVSDKTLDPADASTLKGAYEGIDKLINTIRKIKDLKNAIAKAEVHEIKMRWEIKLPKNLVEGPVFINLQFSRNTQ